MEILVNFLIFPNLAILFSKFPKMFFWKFFGIFPFFPNLEKKFQQLFWDLVFPNLEKKCKKKKRMYMTTLYGCIYQCIPSKEFIPWRRTVNNFTCVSWWFEWLLFMAIYFRNFHPLTNRVLHFVDCVGSVVVSGVLRVLKLLTLQFNVVLRGVEASIYTPTYLWDLVTFKLYSTFKLRYFIQGNVPYRLEKDNICQIIVIPHIAN